MGASRKWTSIFAVPMCAAVWVALAAGGAIAAEGGPSEGATGEGPAAWYRDTCAQCHGADRTGGLGPALLPESLERLPLPKVVETIANGRVATQMPSYAATLSADQIAALAKWLKSTPAVIPEFTLESMKATHWAKPVAPLTGPKDGGDPWNRFVVVEQGDHHLTVLDGNRFAVLARMPTHFAVHGGPKFSPDGRFVTVASRDGWIEKFDLWALEKVAEVRVAVNTRNVAVSSDGRFVAAANTLPETLVVLDSDLNPLKILRGESLDRKEHSRVAGVYDAPPRRSFVVAFRDMPELWEVSYDEEAKPVFDGLVHDHKMAEGLAVPGFLHPKRTRLPAVLDDFFFAPGYRNLIGASRSGKSFVVNLDVRQPITELPLDGMPHLGSGITFETGGRRVMASTNLRRAVLTVIDLDTWQLVKEIPLCGPGFFVRSHEQSRYLFVDSMMDPKCRDTLTVIDKEQLTEVARLTPFPGKTFAHVEFTAEGRYALASVMEPAPDGALVVIDAEKLEVVRTIPAHKPIGKYNAWNKVHRSEGTSW